MSEHGESNDVADDQQALLRDNVGSNSRDVDHDGVNSEDREESIILLIEEDGDNRLAADEKEESIRDDNDNVNLLIKEDTYDEDGTEKNGKETSVTDDDYKVGIEAEEGDDAVDEIIKILVEDETEASGENATVSKTSGGDKKVTLLEVPATLLPRRYSICSGRGIPVKRPLSAAYMERTGMAFKPVGRQAKRGKTICGLFCIFVLCGVGVGLLLLGYLFGIEDLYIIGGMFSLAGLLFAGGFIAMRCLVHNEDVQRAGYYRSATDFK